MELEVLGRNIVMKNQLGIVLDLIKSGRKIRSYSESVRNIIKNNYLSVASNE